MGETGGANALCGVLRGWVERQQECTLAGSAAQCSGVCRAQDVQGCKARGVRMVSCRCSRGREFWINSRAWRMGYRYLAKFEWLSGGDLEKVVCLCIRYCSLTRLVRLQ